MRLHERITALEKIAPPRAPLDLSYLTDDELAELCAGLLFLNESINAFDPKAVLSLQEGARDDWRSVEPGEMSPRVVQLLERVSRGAVEASA